MFTAPSMLRLASRALTREKNVSRVVARTLMSGYENVGKGQLRAGIIGGMGPDATIQFYQSVIDKTRSLAGAARDQDHIQAAIEMNPHIFDRTVAILQGSPEEQEFVGMQLFDTAKRVRDGQADFAVCVCNTAHYFKEYMEAGLGHVPFLSIIDLTANRIEQHVDRVLDQGVHPDDVGPVGILGTTGCVSGGLYQRALTERDLEYKVPDPTTQDNVLTAIHLCKAGRMDEGRAVFASVLETMIHGEGARMLILGCTELPLLMPEDPSKAQHLLEGITFFDGNDILADTVARVGTGMLSLSDAIPTKKKPQLMAATA